MKVGILGKGPVGDALAAAFTHTGHTVRIGGRAQFAEIAHFIDWRGAPLGCAERPAYARPAGAPGTPSRPVPRLLPCRVRVAPPATDYPRPSAPALPAGQKARPPRGELLVLAVPGAAAEAAVKGMGATAFAGKIVMDVTNPIADEPPEDGVVRVFTGPNDSLGERLQALLPEAKIVKAFNSVGKDLMFRPQLQGGPPTMFYCGNDAGAKAAVAGVIRSFGWEPHDCGAITAARVLEPLCGLWCLPGFQRNDWHHAFKVLA